eukprot:349706_1
MAPPSFSAAAPPSFSQAAKKKKGRKKQAQQPPVLAGPPHVPVFGGGYNAGPPPVPMGAPPPPMGAPPPLGAPIVSLDEKSKEIVEKIVPKSLKLYNKNGILITLNWELDNKKKK